MGKPSIFSRDYKKRMRTRRIRIILGAIIICFAVSGVYLISDKNYLNSFKTIIKAKIDSLSKFNSKKEVVKTTPKVTLAGKTEKAVISTASAAPAASTDNIESVYNIQINERTAIQAFYSNNNGNPEFTKLAGTAGSDRYDISPSKKMIVFLDGTKQNLYLINSDGSLKDITQTTFVGSKDTLYKDNVLTNIPGYIWTDSPAFIDDDNIVFVSQMPYFKTYDKTKYLWIHSISASSNILVKDINGQDLKGQDISVKAASDKGIEVLIDGKTSYVNSKGEISQ